MHPQTTDVRLCMCAGPIDFRHAFLDMTGIDVREGPNTRAGCTCPAAMGFSFAAGTTDGTYVWCFINLHVYLHTPLINHSFRKAGSVVGHCQATKAKRLAMLSGCLYVYFGPS